MLFFGHGKSSIAAQRSASERCRAVHDDVLRAPRPAVTSRRKLNRQRRKTRGNQHAVASLITACTSNPRYHSISASLDRHRRSRSSRLPLLDWGGHFIDDKTAQVDASAIVVVSRLHRERREDSELERSGRDKPERRLRTPLFRADMGSVQRDRALDRGARPQRRVDRR